MNAIKNFMRDEEGAAAVEYGLMVALIAVVIIATVTAIGTNLNTVFENSSDALAAVSTLSHIADKPRPFESSLTSRRGDR